MDESEALNRLQAIVGIDEAILQHSIYDDRIILQLKASENEYEILYTELNDFIDEAESLEIDKESRIIRTKKRTMFIVSAESTLAQVVSFYNPQSFKVSLSDRITLQFSPRSALVGIIGVKKGAWGKYQAPDDHNTVQICYTSPADRLKPEAEEKLIDSFLFQLASVDGVLFTTSPLVVVDDENPYEGYEDKVYVPNFSSLEPFNDGMRLYMAASTVSETELRYLSFYKVIEFFGPVVFRLERNDALKKKLDSPEARKADAEFLGSLYSLMSSVKERSADDRIPQAVLENCVDFIDLIKLLPPSLQKPFNYQTPKQEVESLIKNVGQAMYTTRNKVAHAKSNYTKMGTEVGGAELEQFTKFLEQLALRAIQWYNRLPEHLKTTFKD
jgi:hypothetical protein